MRSRLLPLYLLAGCITVLSFIAGDEPLKKILSRLEKYRSDYPQEKVHLHTDKPYYAIGDNIWFKAYVVNAENHQLSALSKIVYVELINEKDSVKQALRLPLHSGMAWGDFTLNDSLREGNYRLRAYTAWMRNFGEEYFFDKTFRIGNPGAANIITNTHYTFSETGSAQKVQALINYSDSGGKPLANKQVTYTVELEFRPITRGKGITDSKGNLTVSFVNTQPFILKSGKIYTSLKLDESHSISKTIPVKATTGNVDVRFFPESGELVSGIRTKVAFKAVGADGLGATVSGYVTVDGQQQLAEFKSEHAGMGYFALVPQEGKQYSTRIRLADGSEITKPLPAVKSRGYVLNISNLDSMDLRLRISANPALTPEQEVTLLAQSNGVVHYVSKIKMENGMISATIPKKRFPTGIIQFTLFSPQNEPVAERLTFINHSDQLQLSIDPTFSSTKRGRVKLALDVKDAEGNPTAGAFSVAVIDGSKVPFNDDNEPGILSNLLLTSDLKGFIEQPNYYFTNITPDKVRQLDILMLSQGWRRFTWKNLMADNFPPISFKPEQGLQVSGRVTANNGKPIAGGKVTLFSSAGDVLLLDTLTNAEGLFSFNNLYFDNQTRFVIQARNAKDRKNVQIELDMLPPQLVTKNLNAAAIEINVNQSLNTYLVNSRMQINELRRFGMGTPSILLTEVKVVDKKPLVKNSSNLNGAGHADRVITAKDLEYATDIIQYIEGRVPGVVVRNGILYAVRNLTSSFSGPIPMQIIIDGIYVEPEFIHSVNPHDVESIEILKSVQNTSLYGLRGGGGVVIINTKRGETNMGYRTYAQGILSFDPKGYYKAREFYAPNYDDPKVNAKMADLRTTVYWIPQLITGNDGKASVDFFSSDSPGPFLAVVEGINNDGKLGRIVYRFSPK